MRYFIFSFIIMIVIIYVIRYNKHNPTMLSPYYLQSDLREQKENTDIFVKNKSITQISNSQIEIIKKDYQKIWLFLDKLHNTNDILSGKKYFTEEFYKFLLVNHKSGYAGNFSRKTYNHDISIVNITPDGLICALIDSNILVKYETPLYYYFDTVHVAVVLLYQGENWRVDALQFF